MPVGLTGVTAIAAGLSHSLALKNDGTVVAWGRNVEGQTTVPAGLTGVTAIAAGGYHSIALKATEGSLKISKVFDPLTSGFTGTFAISYDCDDGTAHDGTVDLPAGGSATIGGIPTGTSCVVSEPNLPTAPGGWTFDGPSISGSPATIAQGDETVAVTVTVTNTISRDFDETAFEVHRSSDGSASIFVKFWPVATTLTATINDPATVVSPDYQTMFDVVPTDNDGIGGGVGIEYEAKPGDIVTVTDGATTKSHTVIDIEVTSVDVDTDQVSGTVPTPGSPVTVYTEGANRYFTADGSGNWMADFSVTGPDEWVFDIVPGTSGGAEQFDADADSTVYDWEVPRPDGWQLNPATGHYYVYVEDGMSWADAEAHAVSLGGHLVTINDSAENDWVVATFGTWYWIGLSDIAVEGVWVWSSGEPVTYTNWFPSEPNDYLGEDFAEIENRPPIGWNDIPGGEGASVVEAEVAPLPTSFFSVSPIEPPEHMWGQEWAPDSEVTIEIDDPEVAGAVNFSTTAETDGDGRFELYDIPFNIQTGHVVTVSQGTTAKTHEVIDLTVTLIDPVADTVSGVGSPNTETVVFVGDDQLQAWPLRNVTSDGAGAWTADFSVPSADGDPAFDILPPMMTYTYQADEDGDQTQIDARPPSFLVFLDWRGLAGWGWPAEVDLTVTADDPVTGEKPDITLPLATNAEGFFEGGGVFPGLQPGWLITVTYGAITRTHTVRAISITDVDTATDVVRGTADPGTEVWVDVSGAEDGEGVVATADGSGEWAADFSAVYDITVGTNVGVQQKDEGGNGTNCGFEVPFPPVPIPPGTSVETEGSGTQTSGTPTVYWHDPLTVTTTGRSGGTGTATLTTSDGYVQTIPLVETPASSGTYTGTFAAPYPHHGTALISFRIDYPDDPDVEGSFTLYIDPSGVVRDTSGDPVVGATVTLYRSVDPDGPFVVVADGSSIMSPGNRSNPDLTSADGLFGWDVVAGYYKVRAEKVGCSAPGGGAFVETGVLTIPPPVTDLALVLDCLADTDPPTTTITAHPLYISDDDTPTFSFTGDDGDGSGIASFECRIDSMDFSTCESPLTLMPLTDGEHTFRVRAIDVAGNVDPTPDTDTFQVDTSPPTTSITGGPSGLTDDETPTFSFSGTDAITSIDHFECWLDGGGPSTCASGATFGPLADGQHTFYVRAVDRADNADPSPASRTWTIDATAPNTTITSHPSNPSLDTSPTFAFSGSDGSGSGVVGFRCVIDEPPSFVCTSGDTFGPLDEGEHTFYVMAIDQANNMDATPASFTWVIDLTPPTVTITSPTSAPGNVVSPSESSVDAVWSATEAGSYSVRVGGTSCTTGTVVDSGSYASGAVTSNILATELAYGANPVWVCVTDAATSTGSSTVTIYRQVPTTISYSGDTQVIEPTDPTLKATLADGQAACDVSGQTIRFYVDLTGDGDFGDAGESVGAAVTSGTSNSAVAQKPANLDPGIYLVKVEFLGTNECAASSDTDGIVTIVTPDDAATGGGWYQIVNPTPITGASKNVNFGLTTRWSDRDQAYRGQILIHDKQAWRLKGEITSYAKTSSNPLTGTASGIGKLFQWQEVAPSIYDYVLVDDSVNFKVTFTDSGSSKKGSSTKPDTFTVNWITDFSGGAVSPLVTGPSFQPLKGGNLTIR